MRRLLMIIDTAATLLAPMAAAAATAAQPPPATAGAYNDHVIAFIDTRPADANDRIPDNPGGWIETRPGDDDAGLATIDTVKPVGFSLIIR